MKAPAPGERILNPVTNVIMDENSSCEMELTQLRGVSSTVRDTNAELGAGAKLVLTEKLLTHDDQVATSNMKVELKGDDSSVQVISRSVAQDNSKQIFNRWSSARRSAAATCSATPSSWARRR
mgnify:FL=1